jgi:hypothetical protein
MKRRRTCASRDLAKSGIVVCMRNWKASSTSRLFSSLPSVWKPEKASGESGREYLCRNSWRKSLYKNEFVLLAKSVILHDKTHAIAIHRKYLDLERYPATGGLGGSRRAESMR